MDGYTLKSCASAASASPPLYRLLLIICTLMVCFAASAKSESVEAGIPSGGDNAVTLITTENDVHRDLTAPNPCISRQNLAIGNNQIPVSKVTLNTDEGSFSCTSVGAGATMFVGTFTAPSTGSFYIAGHWNGPDDLKDGSIEIRDGNNWCTGAVLACSDDPSAVELTLTKGQTVNIRTAQYSGEDISGVTAVYIMIATPATASCKPVYNLVLNKTFNLPIALPSMQYLPNFCLLISNPDQFGQVVAFTAPMAGTYVFETLAEHTDDTVMEIRDGDCNAPILGYCDDDSSVSSPYGSLVSVDLVAGQKVTVLVTCYRNCEHVTVPITVTSPTVSLPANVETVCRPSFGVLQEQCTSKNNALCSLWGVKLKWVNGCGVQRGRGCQCPQWCGYTCRGGCVTDPACFWSGKKCQARATWMEGTALSSCI
jgi:hypothetical protein